jgi:hypothetical protein
MNLSYSRLIFVNSLGLYAFLPSDICLFRDFIYPLVRHEPNLFPHPSVQQLHERHLI